ncbi:MAG: pyruvate formate lyase-activating protein [Chloroflexi bacterium]|nr:pyruvate formate lyase-activating protein [Chloroflexota bacterium]
MKILAIDIGTGTQDILLFDTENEIENCLQMVLPSPTALIARRIRAATARGEDVLLTGVIMGGGPCRFAANDHLKAGRRVFATPNAAKTFDDDLTLVEKMGVTIVSADEAARVRGVTRIEMRDVDLSALERLLAGFGVDLQFDALAIAVLDHGDAPPNYSDRLFRFEFLAERLRARNSPLAFAFMREQIPARLTRMLAVAETTPESIPLLVIDTAPAAILGALEDDRVRAHAARHALIANIGNSHTLAFRFSDNTITGMFEHHTGALALEQLEDLLAQLAAGTLSHGPVFDTHGHGALIFDARPQPLDFLAVTGPQRKKLARSRYRPYFAAPYGAMMLTGCFGLVRAYAQLNPNATDEIARVLDAARLSP